MLFLFLLFMLFYQLRESFRSFHHIFSLLLFRSSHVNILDEISHRIQYCCKLNQNAHIWNLLQNFQYDDTKYTCQKRRHLLQKYRA